MYSLPVEFVCYYSSEYDDYYRENYNFDDYTDPQGIVRLWGSFLRKMSVRIRFAITYIDSTGDTINIQVINAGVKLPVVYRSFFHVGRHGEKTFKLIPACMAVAPGYVNDGKRNNLFLGTADFNQERGLKDGGGYEVELDAQEIQRLDTMKLEVVFEN